METYVEDPGSTWGGGWVLLHRLLFLLRCSHRSWYHLGELTCPPKIGLEIGTFRGAVWVNLHKWKTKWKKEGKRCQNFHRQWFPACQKANRFWSHSVLFPCSAFSQEREKFPEQFILSRRVRTNWEKAVWGLAMVPFLLEDFGDAVPKCSKIVPKSHDWKENRLFFRFASCFVVVAFQKFLFVSLSSFVFVGNYTSLVWVWLTEHLSVSFGYYFRIPLP